MKIFIESYTFCYIKSVEISMMDFWKVRETQALQVTNSIL